MITIPVNPNIINANTGIQSVFKPLMLSAPISLPIDLIMLFVLSIINSAIDFNQVIEDNVSLHKIPREDSKILNINLMKDKDNNLNELNNTNAKYKLCFSNLSNSYLNK